MESNEVLEVEGIGPVWVRRSTRRRKTVSLTRRDGRYELAVPAGMTSADQRTAAKKLMERLRSRELRESAGPDDDALLARARQLSGRYLEGLAEPASVRWVDNQASRWGSCTPTRGTIRISRRLATFPSYVLDYVLLHELAHLRQADHSPQFWELVNRYPRTERARGFLEGVSWQA